MQDRTKDSRIIQSQLRSWKRMEIPAISVAKRSNHRTTSLLSLVCTTTTTSNTKKSSIMDHGSQCPSIQTIANIFQVILRGSFGPLVYLLVVGRLGGSRSVSFLTRRVSPNRLVRQKGLSRCFSFLAVFVSCFSDPALDFWGWRTHASAFVLVCAGMWEREQ